MHRHLAAVLSMVAGNSRLLSGFSKLSSRWAVGQPLLSLADKSHSQFLLGSRGRMGEPGEVASLISLFSNRSPRVSWVLKACFGSAWFGFLRPYCVISQIYWLHMVYAALGAICFTLVSFSLFWEGSREGRDGI